MSAAGAGPPRLGGTRLITIDGPAGGGKTTLAAALSARLPGSAVVGMDDLYQGWDGLDAALFHRVEAWLLLPISQGLPGRHLVYDWECGRFSRWAEVPVPTHLVLEGVGAGDPVTRDAASVSVWLDVADPLGMQRCLRRDTATGAASDLQDHLEVWQELQASYFAGSGNRSAARIRTSLGPGG